MTRQLATSLTVALSMTLAATALGQTGGDWSPPAPSDTERDWVRFKSGEWLGGDLQQLTDGDVKFDSKELEGLTLDWGDIAEFRSARRHTYRFEPREVLTGTATMKDGKIRVETDSGVVERDRARLVSMIEGEPKELNFWNFEASLGLGLKKGNTNNTDLNMHAMVKRETALTRWKTQYDGFISTRDSEDTDNNHRLNSTLDFFLTRRFYIAVPVFEYYTDEFVNIGSRITVGSSLGYEVFKNKWVLWDVNGGAAYQYQTTTITDDPGDNDAAVVLGTSIETDPLNNLEWDTSYTVSIVVTDIDKTNQNLRSVLSLDIWGPLDLDTTFNWDRVEKPALNEDGTRPVSDDFRLSVGLGIDF